MKNLIASGTLDINKLIPKISSGGITNTNGMPLILFTDDFSVLKFTYHYKTDYDLALERNGEPVSQWQGINGLLISDAINDRVPGSTGIGEVYNSILVKGQSKKIVADILANKNCQPYISSYFRYYLEEINNGSCFDEFTVVHMDEYYGFLRNIYDVPSVIGLYTSIVTGTLFNVVFHYFKIKHYLPSFKHNDLHMENIMMRPVHIMTDLSFNKFVIDIPGTPEQVFYVPYFGFEPMIIDFGLAEIPELGIYSVLDNTAGRQKSLDTGIETKKLFRYVTGNMNELLFLDKGTFEEMGQSGIDCNSKLFEQFKSKGPTDTRENYLNEEYYFTK